MLESILGAAAGAIGSSFQSSASRRAEDRAYNRSLDLMRLQNQFNVDMWNRANTYNSPSNQVALLKAAGINPAMLDTASGTSAASEVTSADANVPYNAQQGQFDPVSKALQGAQATIAALQQEAAIAKLRNDIRWQEMQNDDFKMLLDAHAMELMREEPEYNEDGSVTVYSGSPRNYYQRKMLDERDDRRDVYLARAQRRAEFEVYQAAMPFLKKMPKAQLRSLREDIRSKSLDNSLLEEDVAMMKKYGISSKDSNGWTTLIRASLRNPDAVMNVLDRLIDSAGKVGTGFIRRNYQPIADWFTSHRNP